MGGADTPQPDTGHIDSGNPAKLDSGDEQLPEKPPAKRDDETALMLEDKKVRAQGRIEVQRGLEALPA